MHHACVFFPLSCGSVFLILLHFHASLVWLKITPCYLGWALFVPLLQQHYYSNEMQKFIYTLVTYKHVQRWVSGLSVLNAKKIHRCMVCVVQILVRVSFLLVSLHVSFCFNIMVEKCKVGVCMHHMFVSNQQLWRLCLCWIAFLTFVEWPQYSKASQGEALSVHVLTGALKHFFK